MYCPECKKELSKIETWGPNHKALMKYIKDLWQYDYWTEMKGENEIVYKISTGGWSGNEEIIEALKSNIIFWSMCWYQSRRGGHYIFKINRLTLKE